MKTTREEEREHRSEFIPIDFEEFVHKTDDAFLFLIEGAKEWIPKSQIDNVTELLEDDEVTTVEIPRWLAIERGWE